MRQPLVAPTSMYSMKRSATSRPRKWRAIGRISAVVGAALDDHVDLERAEAGALGGVDAGAARRRPGSRRRSCGGRSRRRARRGSPSRVAGPRPSAPAPCVASSEPLVVSVRSSGAPSTVRSSASIATSRSRSRRSSGSPPVRRILRTPCATNRRARRVDLLEAEQRRVRQERVLLVEHLLRHAVAAAEVAAVGDRDAQVVQRPIAGGRGDCRWARRCAPGWAARTRDNGGRRRR